MKEYHKIQSVFMRDPATKMKTFLIGEWAEPEFGYLADNRWIFTEKVDGTNIRVMIAPDGTITFGGKTDNASIPAFLVARLNERFLPQAGLLHETFPDGACLYGEGYGAKIQKGGGNYSATQDFVLFDVVIDGIWLKRESVADIAANFYLEAVPVIGDGSLHDAIDLCKSGFRSRWGEFEAEGIVARPAVELLARRGHRVITKVKCRDFPKE